MNNSNNRNWAIEYATKLTEHAAGLTIMTVIETAWNNLTPSQQQDILDIYGREDYAAVAIPLDGPPTPHLTSEDWWDKDYGEENPALQQYLAEIRTNPHAPKRQPKTNRQPLGRHRQQIRLLPHLRLQPQHPRHRHVPPIRSQQPRGPLTPHNHRQRRERVRRYYSNVGLTKHPHATYTCRRDE